MNYARGVAFATFLIPLLSLAAQEQKIFHEISQKDEVGGVLQCAERIVLTRGVVDSPDTGISAINDNLSITTNGIERVRIGADGTVSINAFSYVGIVHSDLLGNLSSSLINDDDIAVAAAIADNKLATIETIGKVANSATTATSANIPDTIVVRDGSGNFSAGIIAADLIGTVTGTLIGNASSATSFIGSLEGDVTGTQDATVVSLVGGQTAASVAAGAVLANAATDVNTASALVARNSSGNFSAGIITADLVGTVTGTLIGNASSATSFIGSLEGDVTGTQDATVVSLVGGQTAASVAAGSVLANAATFASVASTIVMRDASGNFNAGIITADLIGTVTGTLVGNASSATSFIGSLDGDVTGTQSATVVSLVGGQTAVSVAAGSVLANAATNANTASSIVKRDASGNFSAGTITATLSGNATTAITATNFSGSLEGDVTGTQDATVVSMVGGQIAANVAAGAVLANAATTANTPNTIVLRDASGNFSAGTITASLAQLSKLTLSGVLCSSAFQTATASDGGSVTAASTTSTLLLGGSTTLGSYTVTFPASPCNGQLFSIVLSTGNSVSLINNGNGASIVNGITTLSLSSLGILSGGAAVGYIYNSSANTWYRYFRG